MLCNAIRLAITAIAFTVLGVENWEQIFHDFGGYAMMPLALGIVVLELWLLAKLTMVPQQTAQEIVVRNHEFYRKLSWHVGSTLAHWLLVRGTPFST